VRDQTKKRVKTIDQGITGEETHLKETTENHINSEKDFKTK